MSVLVVAAHPDDEMLGCAGTMARLTDEGEAVSILILGEGATSRQAQRSGPTDDVLDLEAHAKAAATEVGVDDVRFGGLADNRFDSVDLLDVIKIIEAAVDELEPTTVYCQHGGDLNIDHQRTFQATLTATRPVPGSPVRAVYAFPVNSSTEWAFGRFAPAFRGDTFVDISSSLDRKLAALACYSGEMRDFPHPRSMEAVTAAARLHGSTAGVDAAEVFETVRVIR